MPRMYHEPEQPVDRGSVLCAAQRLPRLTNVPQPALARYFKRSGARVTNAGDGMSHRARLCVHSPPPVALHTPTASTRMHRVRYSNVAVRSGPTSLCAQRMDASQLRACDQQKLDRPVPHNRCQCRISMACMAIARSAAGRKTRGAAGVLHPRAANMGIPYPDTQVGRTSYFTGRFRHAW